MNRPPLIALQIFPVLGSPDGVLNREKYRDLFDNVFVSARFAQLLNEPSLDASLK